jgi:Zn-finger nucleic acid-binding protein
MRCPIDSTDLVVTDHEGIDVRTCPTCQGIWLGQEQLVEIIDQAIISQYAHGLVDLDDPVEVDSGNSRSRRRDKYTEDIDVFDRPRKAKHRGSRRQAFEEVIDF